MWIRADVEKSFAKSAGFQEWDRRQLQVYVVSIYGVVGSAISFTYPVAELDFSLRPL